MVTLRVAVVCERVLTEVDGVCSIIRIFDSVALPPRSILDATLFVSLVNLELAEATSHFILVAIETPEGTEISRAALAVQSPLEAGAAFHLAMPFRIESPDQPETRWLRLAFDTEDQLLTRIPLHFTVVRGAT